MTTQTITVNPSPDIVQLRIPRQGEWTYEHWLNFPDDGWKYEIINGVLYMSPAPTPKHQDVISELLILMRLYAKQHNLGKVLIAACDVKLPGQDVPFEPDIIFVRQANRHIIGPKRIDGVPDLVVEVLSPSNAHYDRKTKFNIYQQEGISEYWMVDYHAETIEIFILVEGTYHLMGKYSSTDLVTSNQLAGFEFIAETIFDF